MSINIKVALGMSGGVDSSASLAILSDAGYGVFGVTHVFRPEAVSDANDARELCRHYGKEHITLHLEDEFKKEVIEYFTNEYKAGRTPNPCVRCNEKVKIPYLFKTAGDHGFVATGHYALTSKCGDRHLLLKAKYENKDQSYVLWRLTQEQLSRIIFPLGNLSKEDVRSFANDAGMKSANRKDSQDICFIPNGDYADFITHFTKKEFAKGKYVSVNGDYLGEHSGHMNYTIGQSRGLGIALGKKMYVVSKCAEKNEVVLGDKSDVMKKTVRAININLIADTSFPDNSRFTAKIRYGKNGTPALVTQTGEDEITAVFDEPVSAPAPGQSLVIYDGDCVVGGGIIV